MSLRPDPNPQHQCKTLAEQLEENQPKRRGGEQKWGGGVPLGQMMGQSKPFGSIRGDNSNSGQ